MKTHHLIQGALIAAIYGALTILLAPISYGPIQIRVAEAMTVLPALTATSIPGLFVGCLVANLISPYGIIDIICGSLATLISAFFSYKLKAKPLLVPLPPVIINGIVIGAMLHYAYGVPNLFACFLWVSVGQFVSCYLIGYPLLRLLKKQEGIFK